MKTIELYPSQELAKQDAMTILNYSKIFDFELEIANELRKQGYKLADWSLSKEIKTTKNLWWGWKKQDWKQVIEKVNKKWEVTTGIWKAKFWKNPMLIKSIDELEMGYYLSDRASNRVTLNIKNWVIKKDSEVITELSKDFIEKDFVKSEMITYLNEMENSYVMLWDEIHSPNPNPLEVAERNWKMIKAVEAIGKDGREKLIEISYKKDEKSDETQTQNRKNKKKNTLSGYERLQKARLLKQLRKQVEILN